MVRRSVSNVRAPIQPRPPLRLPSGGAGGILAGMPDLTLFRQDMMRRCVGWATDRNRNRDRYRDRSNLSLGHEKPDVYRLGIAGVTWVYNKGATLDGVRRAARDPWLRASQSRQKSIPIAIAIWMK